MPIAKKCRAALHIDPEERNALRRFLTGQALAGVSALGFSPDATATQALAIAEATLQTLEAAEFEEQSSAEEMPPPPPQGIPPFPGDGLPQSHPWPEAC